jgi:hypothetical protein
MCLYPAHTHLFSELACYRKPHTPPDSEFVRAHSSTEHELTVACRMHDIWTLAQHSPHKQMLYYAFDSHFTALLNTQITVYHAFGDSPAERLAAAAEGAQPPLLSHRSPPPTPLDAAGRLFAGATESAKSVRYVTARLQACLASPASRDVAVEIAARFLLGAYRHTAPIDTPLLRERVYTACPVATVITCGLTSREIHEIVVEFAAAATGMPRRSHWDRARARAWGSSLGPARPGPVAPPTRTFLSKLVAAAAPRGVWPLSKGAMAAATVAMADAPDNPSFWQLVRSTALAFGCQAGLLDVMLTAADKLKPPGVIAAAAIVRRTAFSLRPLTAAAALCQRGTAVLTVCIRCCTPCTTPKGLSTPMLGLRVDLTTHTQICSRCESTSGLRVVSMLGRMLTFATPACKLVHVVVCAQCTAVSALGAFIGYAPYCAACYTRRIQARGLQKHCFCGRYAIAGAEFPAADDRGHDVVVAACYRHQQFAGLRGRPAVADLQSLSA